MATRADSSDVQAPVLLSLATVGLIPGIALALQKIGVAPELASTTATTATAAVTSALTLAWLRAKEHRTSGEARVRDLERGMLGGSGVGIVLGIGLVTGVLSAALFIVLFSVVHRTINVGLAFGAITISPDSFGSLMQNVMNFATALWFPIAAAMAIPLGCFAHHRAGKGPAAKLAWTAIIAAIIVLAVSAAFNFSLTRSLSGIAGSLPGLLRRSGLVVLATGIGFAVGSMIGRKTQDAFLFGRLMQDVDPKDRDAVIDLIRPLQKTSVRGDPSSGGAGPATS